MPDESNFQLVHNKGCSEEVLEEEVFFLQASDGQGSQRYRAWEYPTVFLIIIRYKVGVKQLNT